MSSFPIQTVPEIEKTPEWCSKHLDYVEQVWKSSSARREKMNSDFNSYNGVKKPDSMNWLTKRYGKANAAHFISYRAHVPKLQLRIGEFLSQPLAANVQTTNRDAKSEKMRQMDFYYGAMAAKPELEHLKEKVGVDVMEGAPIPEDENDPVWQLMNFKDKEESAMQIILNETVLDEDLKMKFATGVLNRDITSMMYGKVERDEEGETHYYELDPREAVFDEVPGDIFLQKSPFLGCGRFITIHEALRRYKWNTKQINLINQIGENPSNYLRSHPNMIKSVGGNLLIMEMHMEWKSVIPTYFKKMPKTATQLLMDSSETHIFQQLDTEEYEKNKEWHDKQVEKGKYEIIAKYREDLWEATRLGSMKELDINCRRAIFQMRSVDDPTRILGYSYTGFLCQTVDGIRISLMNELENLSNTLDIVMYKILSDVLRAKGKTIGFNLAALHKDSSVEKTMREINNEGFLTYDTSATGNAHQRDVSINNIISEYDSGLSSSFGQLVDFKDRLLEMMDRMTGINENRAGQISASATVSNTQSSITASRTITAVADYGTYLYITKVLTKIVESAKLTWGLFKVEKGEQILGTDGLKFLQLSQKLGFKDYGVHIQDGGKYGEVRKFMQGLMEASLNAKEISQEDALRFMLSETFAEQQAIFKEARQRVNQLMQENQQAQGEQQMAITEKQLQTQIAIADADREDRQAARINEIQVQGDVDIRVGQALAGNKITENQHKFENERLLGEQ